MTYTINCPMSLLSFLSTSSIHSNCVPRIISNQTKSSKFVRSNKKNKLVRAPYSLIKTGSLLSHPALSFAAFGAKESQGAGEEDRRALETVLRLYKAIKDREINVLSDLIGEECRCVCNFVSTSFQPLQGKTVLEFFAFLLRNLGKNIEFVVQPTLHDGMTVRVQWKLEWKETSIPIGQGFSFYMCHIYQGKVVIRNVEMFMEPLLHIEPLRLKIMGSMMSAIDKLSSKEIYEGRKGKLAILTLLALFFIASLLIFLSFPFN